MVRSFSNWTQINELFGRGSIIAQDAKSNVRQKMIWRIQDNTSFLVKLIRMPNFIDSSGNLTSDAIAFITQNLNNNSEFVRLFHALTPEFFKDSFAVYTVVKNTENRDKVQVKIVSRSEYPNLPPNVNFIDSNTVKNYLTPEESPIVITPDEDEEEPMIVNTDDKNETQPVKVSEDEKSARKFIYLMRSNSIEYTMEFTPDFKKIAAKANKVGGTNGDISYDQKSDTLSWNAADNSASNDALKLDGAITNGYDKSFLKKMLTDSAFRKKILDEYTAKYGNTEINETTIKSMLYHRNGELIFAKTEPEANAETATAAAATPAAGISSDALSAGLKNLLGSTGQTQSPDITTTFNPKMDGLQTPNTI